MVHYNIAYDVCRYYIEDYAKELGPLFKQVDGYLRSRNLSALTQSVSLFDPQLHGRTEMQHLRQISAFFKKNADFSDEESCNKAAQTSFREAELQCEKTNRRLDAYYTSFNLENQQDEMTGFYVDRMIGFIRRVLGDHSKFHSDLPNRIRLTPGATSTLSRRDAMPHLKLRGRIRCTPRARPYILALAKFFGYEFVRTKSVIANRVQTVLKNWKTHRTIACEPDGNVPLQLAFDSYLKGRLRRYARVDLSSQFRNQEMARTSSMDGKFATVDLAMASDTLSLNTVVLLFPTEWYDFLNDIRSGFYRDFDGNHRKYHKFSSMGNGCTFGIESLVFASACWAVGSREYSVYGDDIVIETELYETLTKLLGYLGFSVNIEKSFSTGLFRESCGGDFYDGHNVTPFYLRSWSWRKSALSHNLNGMVSIGLPEGKLWQFCRSITNDRKLRLVPFNSDTLTGIHISEHDAHALKIIKSKDCIPYFKGYLNKSKYFLNQDSRSLFLWHLDASRVSVRTEPLIRSKVSLPYSRYVNGRILFRVQEEVTPDHLYWWSEYVIRKPRIEMS